MSAPSDPRQRRQLHPLPKGLVELYGLLAVLVVLIPEWLADGETGCLIPRKDVGAMARAIVGLIDDPERAEAYGAAGRARAEEHFGRERHVARLGEMLADAASARPAGNG